jgi:tight adherence protein B
VLAIAIVLTSPSYMPVLINDPIGHKLIMFAFGAMLLGILWIRKIIRIQV